MPLVLSDAPLDWSAHYAWSRDRRERGLAVHLFRLEFVMPEPPTSLIVHVTADSRYRLLLNGRPLGRGPAKGTLEHYGLDTYDLGPELRPGTNTLAAEVRWFGENSPISEVHSDEPGLLVFAPAFPELATPGRWRVRADRSVSPDTTSYHDNARQFLDHMDRIDFRLRPAGDWTAPDFDASAWECAVPVGAPVKAGATWGVADRRQLEHRDIPLLTEEPASFARRRVGDAGPAQPDAANLPWRIGPDAGGSLLLDAGELTTGFPCLRFRGGRDREVRITYSEALGHWIEANGRRTWTKRRRDDSAGQAHGYRDTLLLSGGPETFTPFHWRTFWFILIEILPGAAPCELVSADYTRCVFPQSLRATFHSSDPDAEAIMQVSWRTAQLCAHETYEDCPYYEQQNYIADTRLQALTSFYLANETRLARRCLRLFRDSARPDGLIGSRVPSREPQVIPYFCLHWIFMLEDYWRWLGSRDLAFVRSCLPVVDGVLAYFRERLRPDGFVGQLPHWNMVDRHDAWPRGEPPAVLAGASTYVTCLYIQALEAAMRLHREAGRREDAARWQTWPLRLRTAVRREAWHRGRGVYLEGPNRTEDRASQHTQCAAIAAGVPSRTELPGLTARLFASPELIPCQFMQSYYLVRALELGGAYRRFHTDVLGGWRRMLAQRTSTWWEYPDPTRSDCHAWSAWVAAEYLSTVLGLRPAHPGWTAIRIAPCFDALTWAEGAMDSPAGRIAVSWRREGTRVEFHATAPPGVPVELQLPGRAPESVPAGGAISRRLSLAGSGDVAPPPDSSR